MNETGSRSRVLYIDDDPGIARLVQRHLERAGYAVTTAAGPDEGEALARQGGFDCIALDHYMPGRDGLDLLTCLGDLPDPPPVIFVTGAEEPRIAVAALKSGAADYVLKDAHGTFIELLDKSISQEIARARLRRERDAAEREVRESRDRLERLAAQQKVLLREVNHRVANSLQMISSLIEMQARRVPDEAARGMLRQAAKRVEAVMLVHKRLYTGNDVQYVDMDAYLTGLIEELARSTGDGDRTPRIEIEIAPIKVETDRAVPIGLIVNELITNAAKYAYPNGVPGTIRVIMSPNGNGLRLAVEDDGVGYPQTSTAPSGSGLGSLIVQAMAQSLGGRLERDLGHRGTSWVLEIGER